MERISNELQSIALCNLVAVAAKRYQEAGDDFCGDAISAETFTEFAERFDVVSDAAIKLGLCRKDIQNIVRHTYEGGAA